MAVDLLISYRQVLGTLFACWLSGVIYIVIKGWKSRALIYRLRKDPRGLVSTPRTSAISNEPFTFQLHVPGRLTRPLAYTQMEPDYWSSALSRAVPLAPTSRCAPKLSSGGAGR